MTMVTVDCATEVDVVVAVDAISFVVLAVVIVVVVDVYGDVVVVTVEEAQSLGPEIKLAIGINETPKVK